MCGILACLSSMDGQPTEHRGVRTSMVEDSGWKLYHTRLPIVGLDKEWDQPRKLPGWTLAFVGELLDFRDDDVDAESDVEEVCRGWLQEGPDAFIERDGFWAIVAIEQQGRELHVLVDYLNQKPMYYRRDYPAVASELDAVARLAPVEFDPVYFAAVAKWGYCPETWRTPYKEINRTQAGEHVILTQEGYLRRQTMDYLVGNILTPGELKVEIEQAVRRRVVASDVPVAVLASGGLDSSIVAVLAARYGEVQAYHVENEGDEPLPGSVRLTSEDVGMEEALKYMQEPLDLGSLVPQVALSKALAGKVNVCLTGDGADEMFGGYGRASRYDSQASDIFHELVGWHMPRLDAVMMRNRVEVRSPFLARTVVEAALALPWDPDRRDKKILRDLFRDDLPPGVADRPKRPLRTKTVETDREKNTLELIRLFTRRLLNPIEILNA